MLCLDEQSNSVVNIDTTGLNTLNYMKATRKLTHYWQRTLNCFAEYCYALTTTAYAECLDYTLKSRWFGMAG